MLDMLLVWHVKLESDFGGRFNIIFVIESNTIKFIICSQIRILNIF